MTKEPSLCHPYDYIETGRVDNELAKRIYEDVIKSRRNEVCRTQYMKEWVVIQAAKDEGGVEGIKRGIKVGRK